MASVRVKVCCIASVEEARLAIAHGADAIGLVSEMPSGPGVIDEEKISEIVAAVGSRVDTFLLTSRRDPDAIARQQRRTGVNTVQLCDDLPEGGHEALRAALPTVSLVQVIHVRDESSLEQALEVAPRCDALLLDSGNPGLAVKELGGTGRTHDWRLSRRIVEQASAPVYLAGGLREDNVSAAVEQVGPYAVDLCTGVREAGRLDEARLGGFFRALRGTNR